MAIVGAGGVGLGIGSCLLHAGVEVVFVVRREAAADALRAQGLLRTGVFGRVEASPETFEVTTRIDDLTRWRPDTVLVCTKTTGCDDVATRLSGAFPRRDGPAPAVVLCVNGWGTAERVAAHLPAESIFNARVITGFRRQSDREVDITVHAEAIHIGSLFGADAARIAPLCRAIDAGGIPCAPSDEIGRDLLAKLLYNCALNPLAALRGVPYGAIGEDPASRAVLERVVHEIFAVLEAKGLETHWKHARAYLAFFFETLLPPTREHESSMLQDLRANRKTEIDSLCGAVVALGREAGVETPTNDALAVLIRGIEGPD